MIKMSDNDFTFISTTVKDMIDCNSIEETKAMSKVLLNYLTAHTITESEFITVKCDVKDYSNRISVIKELRQLLGLGLKEAKEATEQPGGIIYKTTDIKKAIEIYKAIKPYCKPTIEGSDALKVLFGDKND